MRTIACCERPSIPFTAQGRGFSNCTSGKEEWELRMRTVLRLPVTSTAATKSKKLADSALLGRQRVVPMKYEAPVSPPSVFKRTNPVLKLCGDPESRLLGLTRPNGFVCFSPAFIETHGRETHS